MKILFFLRYSSEQASSRIRGFNVAQEFSRNGETCEIIYGEERKKYLDAILKLPFYDIIFIQKKYAYKDILLNKIARFARKKTLFDLDDAPGGVILSSDAEKRAAEIMKDSSAVIVGSHKLRDFAKQFNKEVFLIPSAIDLDYYKLTIKKKGDSRIVLGWSGNGIVYKNDLLTLLPPLKKIGKKHAIKFIIIGALGQKEIYENFSAAKEMEVEIIDWINSGDNPAAVPSLISQFDVGLYPLLSNEYNEYKCGLKGLEYMAAKVPLVASPVSETKYIVEDGEDGFFASTEEEWEEKICCLIENRELREKMGEAGRKKVENSYSLKVCANELMKVFEKIEKQ